MKETDNDIISVEDAAAIVGVTGTRIRSYIREKRLPAQMIGNSYVLRRGDAKAFKPMKTGRPKLKK